MRTRTGTKNRRSSENPTNSPSAPQLSPSARRRACAHRAVLTPGRFSILFAALAQKKPRLAEARRSQFSGAPCYLLATVAPRFHTDSDLPPEPGAGLLTLS